MSSKVETIGRVSGDALEQIKEHLKQDDLSARLDDPIKNAIVSISSYFDCACAARGHMALIFTPKYRQKGYAVYRLISSP